MIQARPGLSAGRAFNHRTYDCAMDSGTATASTAPSAATLLRGIARSLRPRQWIKNSVVLAALVFDLKLFQAEFVVRALIGVACLCLLSSAVYLINDCLDVKADRQHPKKSKRPIARGDVPIPVALAVAAGLIVTSLAIGFSTDLLFGVIALSYLALTTAYSIRLKHVVILDVLVIAAGFVLRVAAGAELVNADNFSPWLYVCMSLLALLLGFGKRRQEIVELGDKGSTRRILKEYNLALLDQIVSIVTGALLIAYSVYSFSGEKLPADKSFMLTIPFVLYGVFRYLYLMHVRGEGGAPDELILKDRPMQLAVGLYTLTAVAVLYLAGRS
jgi:4-hydroxybenzoate polyprenyltransferase